MTVNQEAIDSSGFMESIAELKTWLYSSDKILIGAGAGLTAAAGLSYLDEDLFRQFQPEMALGDITIPMNSSSMRMTVGHRHGNGPI